MLKCSCLFSEASLLHAISDRLERSVDDEKHAKERLERQNIELTHKIEMGQKYMSGLKNKKKESRSRGQVAKQVQRQFIY